MAEHPADRMTLTDDGPRAGANGQLRPFTSETAREAAQRSVQARRDKAALKKRENDSLAAHLRTLRASFERDDLGPSAAAMAQHLMSQVITGLIPVRNGAEAAELIRCGVDIARLEAGQNTSQTAHIAFSAEQVQARLAELQARVSPGQSALPAAE